MTGVRQSIVFQLEDAFGEGNPSREDENGLSRNFWVHAPPGTWFTSTHRRDVKRVQSMGSKFWDTVAFGPLSGTWEWTFYLDYNYPEPLFLIFEGGANKNVLSRARLRFSKQNDRRVPSFTVRRKLLNSLVNGAENEVSILKGCVVTNASFTRQANSSYIQVRMSGFYASEELYAMTETQMDETDYTDYEGSLVEYACFTNGPLSGSDENNSALIQNTDSLTISIANSAEAIYNTCAPFALNYAEGLAKISFSASSYANHPSYYQLGVYTGGKDFNLIDAMESSARYSPGSKGMAPLQEAYITSYDAMARDTDGIIGRAYADSDKSSEFLLKDVVMSALAHQKGDNGKLVASVNNCPVRKLVLTLKSEMEPYTLRTGPDAWEDRFFYLPEEGGLFKNHVFVEYPPIIQDGYGITYQLNNLAGTAKVLKAPFNLEGDITILSKISLPDGTEYKVTEISNEAFRNTAERPVHITSVTIPSSVERIGWYAFQNVAELASVIGGIPTEEDPEGGVKQVQPYAFDGCSFLSRCDMLTEAGATEVLDVGAFRGTALTTLYLSEKFIPNISNARAEPWMRGTFANVPTLVSVTIPITVDPVGRMDDGTCFDGVFYGSSIQSFTFYYTEGDVPIYAPSELPDGADYSDYAEEHPDLVPALHTPWYGSVSNGTQVSVSWGRDVTEMPQFMFFIPRSKEFSYSFTKTNIPYLKLIGNGAFYNSGLAFRDGLRTLKLTDMVSIGDYAFYNVPGLLRVIITSTIMTTIGKGAICYDEDNPNTSLYEINLGGCSWGRYTSISGSFQGIAGLTKVILPYFVRRMDWLSFNAGNTAGVGYYEWYPARSSSVDRWDYLGYRSDGEIDDLRKMMHTRYDTSIGDLPKTFMRVETSPDPNHPEKSPDAHAMMQEVKPLIATWSDMEPNTWGSYIDSSSNVLWGLVGGYDTSVLTTRLGSVLPTGLDSLGRDIDIISPVPNPKTGIREDIDLDKPVAKNTEESEEQSEEPSEDKGELTLM